MESQSSPYKPSNSATYVFVNLVKGCDSLYDVVVLLLDTELDLGSRVGVAKTEDRPVNVAGLKLLDELARVLAESTEQVGYDLGSVARLARQVGKRRLNASRQVLLAHTQSDGLLLSSFWQVCLECRT